MAVVVVVVCRVQILMMMMNIAVKRWCWLCGLPLLLLGGCQLTLQLPTAENQAKFYIDAIAKSQTAYYKANGEFASSIEQLDLNLNIDSPDYKLTATSHGEPTHSVLVEAAAKKDDLHSYAGLVYVKPTEEKVDVLVQACKTEEPSKRPPMLTTRPRLVNAIDCPEGSVIMQ
ncbi:MAG: general secretion pathway protein GspH [Spirulina sp. SIO3F2]|nr:general secretion pathway protein GspH [Spirulina sp. SIO3F2]